MPAIPFRHLLALVVAVFAHAYPARGAIAAGSTAPDFTFVDLQGTARKLSDFRGKIVVLEWLNPACPYVQRHYKSGNLPSIQTQAAADGVVWLQINSSAMGDLDPKTSLEWQKKQGAVATAYVRDQTGRIGRLFDAQTTPHLYVVDRAGALAYQGAIDDQPSGSVATVSSAHNYVRAALAALIGGKSVEKTVTKPYGCAVKYAAD